MHLIRHYYNLFNWWITFCRYSVRFRIWVPAVLISWFLQSLQTIVCVPRPHHKKILLIHHSVILTYFIRRYITWKVDTVSQNNLITTMHHHCHNYHHHHHKISRQWSKHRMSTVFGVNIRRYSVWMSDPFAPPLWRGGGIRWGLVPHMDVSTYSLTPL